MVLQEGLEARQVKVGHFDSPYIVGRSGKQHRRTIEEDGDVPTPKGFQHLGCEGTTLHNRSLRN